LSETLLWQWGHEHGAFYRPQDQEDLVIDRPTGGVTEQQAFKAEEAALGITGQLAAGQLEKILDDTLHLDSLSIDPGEEDITKGLVSLGKYVTPNVFVIYRHSLKTGEGPELEVTYEINRNLGIEVQEGSEKTSGVDLMWEHEF